MDQHLIFYLVQKMRFCQPFYLAQNVDLSRWISTFQLRSHSQGLCDSCLFVFREILHLLILKKQNATLRDLHFGSINGFPSLIFQLFNHPYFLCKIFLSLDICKVVDTMNSALICRSQVLGFSAGLSHYIVFHAKISNKSQASS